MEIEIWKKVPDEYGLYEASTHGRVRSIAHQRTPGRILKPCNHPQGYHVVTVTHNGRRKNALMHRLIGYAFLGLKKGEQINHKDGDKQNNHLSNLEVCNGSHNQRHRVWALDPGRKTYKNKKIQSEHEPEIMRLLSTGMTLKKVGEMFGVSKEIIFNIKKAQSALASYHKSIGGGE